MRSEIDGRVVLHCDQCRARLDMGPLRPQSFRGERMPSGWLTGSEGKHFCTICSPSAVSRFLRR